MIKIGIILGSTRPGRSGAAVARWVLDRAVARDDAEYELIDLADHPLPLLDEPIPAAAGQYAGEHTKSWSKIIDRFDGYVFVTPEYNHSTSGVLKNAIDYLFNEWADKAAAFVSYGSHGGVRAVEHLRLIAAQVRLATVRDQVALSLFTDFENYTTFRPAEGQIAVLDAMLAHLTSWAGALRAIRVPTGERVAVGADTE